MLSTTAFGIGAKYLAYYEMEGVGSHFHNIHRSPLEGDSFTLFHVIVMMAVDIVLYGVLVWYVENVFPGQYGLRKPWYFPFSYTYWTAKTYSELIIEWPSCCVCSKKQDAGDQLDELNIESNHILKVCQLFNQVFVLTLDPV